MGRRKKSEDCLSYILGWVILLGIFIIFLPVTAPLLLIGGGIYLYVKWPRSCAKCGNQLKRVSYRWPIGKVCPHCNQRLERKASKEAFEKETSLPRSSPRQEKPSSPQQRSSQQSWTSPSSSSSRSSSRSSPPLQADKSKEIPQYYSSIENMLKQCTECKFWVETTTKQCPNCGTFYPTGTGAITKAIIQGIVIALGFTSVIDIIVLLRIVENSIGEILRFIVILWVTSIIIGAVAGKIYKAYLNIVKVKFLEQPCLNNDEQKISQRQQKLDEKKREIREAMGQLDKSLQLVKKPTEKLKMATRTLENAFEAITRQHNEYSLKLWEISLMRWYNALKPLTIIWESYFITSDKPPTRDQYDVYRGELQNIHRHGQALLDKIIPQAISSNKENLYDYSIQLYDALEAVNRLITEVVERRIALMVQDAVEMQGQLAQA